MRAYETGREMMRQDERRGDEIREDEKEKGKG